MTADLSGAAAAETRAWQPGDWAWLVGRMWMRTQIGTGDGGAWWSDVAGFGSRGRTDAEMTAAGAQLVATADGPVTPAGALIPQVLTEDSVQPAPPWRLVEVLNPTYDWHWKSYQPMPAADWLGTIAVLRRRPVYVIGGDRG